MSITISDAVLVQALVDSDGTVSLVDSVGYLLGHFTAGNAGRLPPGVKMPFTDEQLAERRKDTRPGRPLKDILADLQAMVKPASE